MAISTYIVEYQFVSGYDLSLIWTTNNQHKINWWLFSQENPWLNGNRERILVNPPRFSDKTYREIQSSCGDELIHGVKSNACHWDPRGTRLGDELYIYMGKL